MELENVPKVGSETPRLAPAHHLLLSNPLPPQTLPLKAVSPECTTAWHSKGSHCCWREHSWHGPWQAEAEEKLPALLCSRTRAMASGARETHCGDANSISANSDSGICKELLQNDQSASVLQGKERRAEITHLLQKLKYLTTLHS